MSQIRIFVVTNDDIAQKIAREMEFEFENMGLPISSFEAPDNPDRWTVSVYADSQDREHVSKQITSIFDNLNVELTLQIEELPDIDWVAATLRELSAVQAGRYVIHGSHEPDAPKPNEISLQINAGLAFGTGHHGTTAGCLDMLTRVSKKQDFYNILDLGTGSGILAIAAAKTHHARVLASDIDPVATTTAHENCRINWVHNYVECITATGFQNRRFGEQGPFDLVVANILARPLQSMALEITLHTMIGGTIILSGLLPHQRSAILATFRLHGAVHEYTHYRDNWMTLVLKRP